jgi:hypothetical protein
MEGREGCRDNEAVSHQVHDLKHFGHPLLWGGFVRREGHHVPHHLVDRVYHLLHLLPTDIAIVVSVIQLEGPCMLIHLITFQV